MFMLLRLLGIGRYNLPSLKGCPRTNHITVRQISADIDGIVAEKLLTLNAKEGKLCPACLHGVQFHDVFCHVAFRETDRHGIVKKEQCFCLMDPDDILRTLQASGVETP